MNVQDRAWRTEEQDWISIMLSLSEGGSSMLPRATFQSVYRYVIPAERGNPTKNGQRHVNGRATKMRSTHP